MIRNLAEDHVATSYDALRKHFPDFCGCEICREDVLVFALNRTPPRYVATLEGTVVTDFNLDKEQNRAAIDVGVMEGFRRIAGSPRCGARNVRRT